LFSAGYPKGDKKGIREAESTPKISFTSFSLNAAIQQVPKPSAKAAKET
jgi:hypothetical protein